jgi:hypothetical protein
MDLDASALEVGQGGALIGGWQLLNGKFGIGGNLLLDKGPLVADGLRKYAPGELSLRLLSVDDQVLPARGAERKTNHTNSEFWDRPCATRKRRVTANVLFGSFRLSFRLSFMSRKGRYYN